MKLQIFKCGQFQNLSLKEADDIVQEISDKYDRNNSPNPTLEDIGILIQLWNCLEYKVRCSVNFIDANDNEKITPLYEVGS